MANNKPRKRKKDLEPEFELNAQGRDLTTKRIDRKETLSYKKKRTKK